MEIKETKEKLHLLIEQTNNEVLPEDLLLEANSRNTFISPIGFFKITTFGMRLQV